jgi:hypothetical protein
MSVEAGQSLAGGSRARAEPLRRGRATRAAASRSEAPSLGAAASRLSLWLGCGTLALAPLPFGSVTTGAVALWCCVLAVAVMLAPLSQLERRHWLVLAPVLAIALLFAVIVALQSRALPADLRDPIWEAAAAALREPVQATLSVGPGLAHRNLGLELLMLLAFLNAFLVATDRSQARLLFLVAAYAGAAYALYGILAYTLAPNSLLWAEKHYYRSSLTATFVNRNTAATFFGTASILWLILVIAELDRRLPKPGGSLGNSLSVLLKTSQTALVVRSSAFLLCFAATLMTTSRAGCLIAVLALGFALLLYGRPRLKGRLGGRWGIAALALVGLVLMELWSGGVGLRLSQNLLRLDQRWESYDATLAIIGEHFWLGSGLGTYAGLFPAYRPAGIMPGIIWDIAHSTPLELAAELGVPFALVVVLVSLFLMILLVRGALAGGGGAAYCAAAAAVALLGAGHSAVDFSLQIPGYAVVFTMIVACGLAQSMARPRRTAAGDGAAR